MVMNIFRLAGDALHTLAIVMLPYKLHTTGSAAGGRNTGVSIKTQELYLLVFLTRYADLSVRFISIYNTALKITYICLTAMAIVMIRRQPSLKTSYEAKLDYFRYWRFAVFPSIIITVLLDTLNEWPQNVVNEFWVFSEVLEPVAMVPQLLLLRQRADLRKVGWIYRYVVFMAAYRGMYMLNWVFRAYNEFGYRHHPLPYIGSIVQISIILIFFVEHVTRLALGFRRLCQRRRLKEGGAQHQPLWQPIHFAEITPRSHVGSILHPDELRRNHQPLHVLSDEVDIMDSNSFARERLLQRGRGFPSNRARSDGFEMESPLRPQSYGGFVYARDSAPAVEGGGAATGSSEAGCGVDGVHIV